MIDDILRVIKDSAPRVQIPSDETIRRGYRAKRYLEDLADCTLLQRGRDLFLNLMTIGKDGKFCPLPLHLGAHWYFRKRFDEFLEECRIRHGNYPNGFEQFTEDLRIPRPDSAIVTWAIHDAARRDLTPGTFMAKYGCYEQLCGALRRGRLRIAPASSYLDNAHNSAVRDDELSFTFYLHDPSPKDFEPYAKFAPGPIKERFQGSIEITETTREDYYVFCLSAAYEPRLFADFEANACLLIQKPKVFLDRLMQITTDALGARGWSFQQVTYVDPMTETGAGTPIAFRKNFRYCYQREWRAAWQPSSLEPPLQAHFVEIGPLDDIAELIAFDPR